MIRARTKDPATTHRGSTEVAIVSSMCGASKLWLETWAQISGVAKLLFDCCTKKHTAKTRFMFHAVV